MSNFKGSKSWRLILLFSVFALVVVACGGDTAEEEVVEEATETTAAPAPTPMPEAPTPTPVSEDETKKKAKVKAKRVAKKASKQGTTQLATTKKPKTGGLRGITTGTGTNTTAGGGTGGSYV